ncbi:IQ motif, EF-hand binding site [Phytophthora cactorum]|nr:IQ motif, EF-hand binding site [Phytophthora cactorum]
MGLKKAPLLGSSASVGETGQSVIEGDRSLLSHFGSNPSRQDNTLNVAARKSAALRRNLVARGLTKQYSGLKTREESLKTQVPRHQLQQKILENYRRHQAANDEKIAKYPERHEDSDEEDDFSHNAVLVVPKRTNSAPSKASNRPTRRMSPIVPPKGATSFLRNTRMRQFPENQDQLQSEDEVSRDSNQDIISARLKLCPSEADVPNLKPVSRPVSSSRVQKFKDNIKADVQSLTKGPAPWLSLENRSSQIVLRELAITKDIMMREQLVRQLKQTLPTIDALARDFLKAQDDLKQAEATLEAAKVSPSRMKKTGSLIGLTTTPTEAEQVQNVVAEAETIVTESKTRLTELTKRMSHHTHHVEILIEGLQQFTLSVVEGILDWRQLRQRRRQLSNFQRLFRFPWRRQQTFNYLVHVDDDLRMLFPSVALEVLLVDITKIQDALANSVKRNTSGVDHDRLRQCLEAIYHEKRLEALEKQRCGEEEARVQNTYDPFSTIKAAGGVEETLSNLMAIQSPHSHLLGEQLRIRQEDFKRVALSTSMTQNNQTDTPNDVLQVNPERLRLFFEKRAALLESSADCELRDAQPRGHKNKIQGKMVVRKNNEKRVENYLARKIQLQYLAHRQRHAIRTNLTQFVQKVQASVVDIQRVFRGHRAKCNYKCMRSVWLEHRQQVAAIRTIINSFRRYRRRQRHRRSMTVESIAQVQLITLLANKLNDPDQDGERYRRAGEERRRQRIVLLQKHKMEQQELERLRAAAAIRMQAVVRAHLAQGQARVLRQEKKAHMNAERSGACEPVGSSDPVDLPRIQLAIESSGQLDEKTRQTLASINTLNEEDTDGDEDDEESASSSDEDEILDESDSILDAEKTGGGLPPIADSRPSSSKSSAISMDEMSSFRSRIPSNSVSLPPLWARDGSSSSLLSSTSSTGTARRSSIGMTRIELKLKEAEIGDKFDTPPSRRSSFVGNLRHQTY